MGKTTLEKNKDYIEIIVSCTDCTFTPDEAKISVEGYSYGSYWRLPDTGEPYVIISKEKFEALQTENEQDYREMAKQLNEANEALLKRVRHYHELVKELRDEKEAMERHIQELESHNVSLAETNTILRNSKDSYIRMAQANDGYLKDWENATGCAKPEHVKKKINSLENEFRVWHDISDHQLEQIHGLEEEVNKFYDMFDGCEPDYVKQRIDEMKDEIENLNKKLEVCDPFPEFKDNRIGGCQRSVNGWRGVSSFWRLKYKTLSKLVGFSSVEEIEDYLVNEAECNTLNKAISKLHNTVCVETRTASSYREQLDGFVELHDKLEGKCKELESQIKAWKEATGFKTPDGAKEYWTAKLSESGEFSESLAREVRSWKDATGCSTPEEVKAVLEYYLDANKKRQEKIVELSDDISGRSTVIESYKRNIEEWQKATGCKIPEAAKDLIESRLSWHHAYNQVIEKNQKLADDVEAWKDATGRIDPEAAKQYINRLKGRLNKIHECAVDW